MSALLFIVLHWRGVEAITSEVQRSSDWRKKSVLSNKDYLSVISMTVLAIRDSRRTTQITTQIK